MTASSDERKLSYNVLTWSYYFCDGVESNWTATNKVYRHRKEHVSTSNNPVTLNESSKQHCPWKGTKRSILELKKETDTRTQTDRSEIYRQTKTEKDTETESDRGGDRNRQTETDRDRDRYKDRVKQINA